MNLREQFVELLPKPAIRVFAGPYVAGVSMEAAVTKAGELAGLGVASTIDVLGEDVANPDDIKHYTATYHRLAEAVAKDARLGPLSEAFRPSISLKPSMFLIAPKDEDGMIRDPKAVQWDECEKIIRGILAITSDHGIRVTIDMENHQWTDGTLELHARLFSQYGRAVGTVLQSRLNRTADDIEKLPDGSRIRLCIGIYNEPATVATRDDAEMKGRMIPMAKRLLEKNVFLEFATHDLPLIHRFATEVVLAGKISADRFETQGLLGVPRQHLIEQLISGEYFANLNGSSGLGRGIVHRLYVPFAEHWDQAIAYCRRRLRHSPKLFWTGFVSAPKVLYYSFFGK